MGFMNWSPELSVNVKEIDAQHQRLIELINELHDAMEERKGKDALEKIIKELFRYTVYHFSTEEKYFELYNYPEKDAHVEEHNVFIRKVQDFHKGFNEGRMLLSVDVMNFLTDWIKKHIMGSDKKYGPFFNEKGLH